MSESRRALTGQGVRWCTVHVNTHTCRVGGVCVFEFLSVFCITAEVAVIYSKHTVNIVAKIQQ